VSEPTSPEDAPTEASPAEVAPVESPTEAVAPTEAVPVDPEPAADAGASASESPSHGWSTGRVLVVGILVLVLGAGAGFLVGRSTADTGPATLAAAVDETAKGDLPAGDLSLDQLLGAASDRLGADSGGLLGGLPGGSGKGGDTSGVLGQILEQLGNRFGNGGTTTPATPDTSEPFLGVALEAVSRGQSGAKVAQVAAGSPAADAGVRVGDVVTAVDGKTVADPAAVATAVRAQQPGDQLTLTLTRDGASTDVKVRLGNADSSSSTPTTPPTTRTT
jgi:membrane-associated protease RseP (regulator of RpoE activity)